MQHEHKDRIEPDLQIDMQLPIPTGFDLDCSLQSASDPAGITETLIDVLGSAVAEATGWRPPESEE